MKKIKLILLLIKIKNCSGQINKNQHIMEEKNRQEKRLPNEITIESPIKAELEVYVEETDLIAKVKLINTTDKSVILPNNRIGGRCVQSLERKESLADVFYAIPIPYKKNLTFRPTTSLNDSVSGSGYTILQPNEIKVTYTKLNKIFDLNEQKYEKIRFIFSPCIPLLSEKHKQIREENDPQKRRIIFYIHSNKAEIAYDEIKDRVK